MAPKKYRQKIKQQKQSQQTPKPLKKRKSNSNKSVFIAIGVIAVIIIIVGALAASGLMGGNGGTTTNPTNSPDATTIPASSDPYANSTYVFFHTSMGNFTVALRNDMPITTSNFLNMVREGVYDGSKFHRVWDGFMIQAGIPADGSQKPTIQDEFTSTNHNYNMTIAMANTGAADSGSSQFFINVANNNNRYSTFDSTYPAFGKIIYGEDVVMAISHVAVKDTTNYVPVNDVTIIDARVLN